MNNANYKTEYESRDLRHSLIARNNNMRVYDFISVRIVLTVLIVAAINSKAVFMREDNWHGC